MSPVPPEQRPVTDVQAVAVRPGRHLDLPEQLATEEPMEVRAAGPGQESFPVAVTMRTPGHDFDLAAGFLVTEGLVQPAEIAAVAYCDSVDVEEGRYNAVTVSLTRRWDDDVARRSFLTTSSCGVCGKASIDQVELSCPVVAPGPAVPASRISELPDRLRHAQRIFERTGGLHAAGCSPPRATWWPCERTSAATTRWTRSSATVCSATDRRGPGLCSWCRGGSASRSPRRRPWPASASLPPSRRPPAWP